jgi:hypothetical protein
LNSWVDWLVDYLYIIPLVTWDLHALTALLFVILLLSVSCDRPGSTAPGDQSSAAFKVVLSVDASDCLKGPELILSFLLGHAIFQFL